MTTQTVNTRVKSVENVPEVQFETSPGNWNSEIEVTFNSQGTATFSLYSDATTAPYVFFGATQIIKSGTDTSSDTNWSLTINELGKSISFTTNDNVTQDIGIKLALIQQNSDDLNNDIISADPVLKNIKL
jgi:hypothetical protein